VVLEEKNADQKILVLLLGRKHDVPFRDLLVL
jgi:hypothetical protein